MICQVPRDGLFGGNQCCRSNAVLKVEDDNSRGFHQRMESLMETNVSGPMPCSKSRMTIQEVDILILEELSLLKLFFLVNSVAMISLLLLLLLNYAMTIQPTFGAEDTLTTSMMIRDGDTMISSNGVFEVGFFSPGNSTNRYLGMWYKNITVRRIVWVANREAPLANSSGALKVISPGFLRLLNDTNGTVWSSNASRSVQNPVAQLLDYGNLVVRDANDDAPENFLWQSFDYPTDTALPGIKFGRNYVTGIETYITSWKSDDDPAPGDFSMHFDPTGYPQVLLKKGTEIQFRMGPWNGFGLSGAPNPQPNPIFRLQFVMNEKEVYIFQGVIEGPIVTLATINQSGYQQRWTWVDQTQSWVMYANLPADGCDQYKFCGAYGTCNNIYPLCRCLDRFVPKDQEGWDRSDRSKGCIRQTNLSCKGDIFLKYPGIKLPDSRSSRYVDISTLEECKVECLKNCSCVAYTQLDRNKGTGCLFWFEDLIDMKDMPRNGDDIYIRMSSLEADTSAGSNGKKKEITIAVSLTSGMVIILIGISLFLRCRKQSKDTRTRTKGKHFGSNEKDSELPLFDLSIILKATNHFSIDNKLGEGGFGPVYRGVLEGGQEIAVKRLSKDSKQGLDEFKNEINFIVKLQHRNLVRLLGGCIQGEENMLIYEYMPNKSLDIILFDQTKSMSLDWKKRFNIINGISRGLTYLHQDSRLRIIHRDLKASNVLLDSDMNPKISDFGLARSFGRNETEAITRRVVGTFGYMSPEYAVDGLFSLKSDVFSFGVLLLEIVSGMRNRMFSYADHNLNLLGHAWKLYKEGRSLEIVDPCLIESLYISEMERTIHVGLLCVQQNPEDRPSMSTVFFMLSNEGVFPHANQPGFFTEREVIAAQGSTNSANRVTITTLEAR